jgi:hypothetical protein
LIGKVNEPEYTNTKTENLNVLTEPNSAAQEGCKESTYRKGLEIATNLNVSIQKRLLEDKKYKILRANDETGWRANWHLTVCIICSTFANLWFTLQTVIVNHLGLTNCPSLKKVHG